MSVTPDLKPAPASDTRDAIRNLFARLLNDTPAQSASPDSLQAASDDPFAGDPFADDAFDSDPLIADLYAGGDLGSAPAARADGDGFGRLEELSADASSPFGADPLHLSLGERAEDQLDWGDLADVSADLGETSEESIFADPFLMDDLLQEGASADVEDAAAGAEGNGRAVLEAADRSETAEQTDLVAVIEPVAYTPPAPGSRSTLAALPDRPPTGTHRVALLTLVELDNLNDVLQNGWRVIQLLPSGEPSGFIVALRYAGYSA